MKQYSVSASCLEEVLEYVKEHTLDMFEPEGGYACMSLFHGLCE